MLEVILVFALISVVIKFAEKPLIKKIAFAQDTQEAIMGRKKLIVLRSGLIVLLLGLYILFSIVISDFDAANTYQQYMWLICAVIAVGVQQYGFKNLLGNISTLTKVAFLSENKDFVLFLRGFIDDDYSDIAEINQKDFDKFSEYGFMSLLESKNISACAIGMTKEADSPIGAKRIYVDDISWKQDVEELINKSKSIYILIRNRESCIWEIEKSLKYFNKITLIVDDIAEYNNVRRKFEDIIELPSVSAPPLGAIVVLTYDIGRFKVALYSNSIEGYAKMLNFSAKDVKDCNKRLKRKKRAINLSGRKTLVGAFIAVLIFFVISVVSSIYFKSEEIKEGILSGDISLTNKEKLDVIEAMQAEFEKKSAIVPMQVDEHTILKRMNINENCQIIEYDIVGLNADDVNFFEIKSNIVRGFTKEELGLWRSLGIELVNEYHFDDEVREIRFTRDEINRMYENMVDD